MIRIERSLVCRCSPKEAFSLVADFGNLPQWDPGIVSSEKLDPGPLGVDTRFRVSARFAGRNVPMTYRVSLFDPSRRVVLEGDAKHLRAIDDIHFEPAEGGTRIRYRADFTLLGPLAWAEVVMRPAFDRLADRAMSGMDSALKRKAA